MKVRLTLVSLIAGLTTFVAATAVAIAGPEGSDNGTACVLNTRLLPENEIKTTPNTSVASGHAQIKVRNDGTIEFKTFVLNPAGENFHAAHIHGPATSMQSTGIVVDLLVGVPVGGGFTDMTTTMMGEGIRRATAPADIATRICANPELYYVNFHTQTEPAGAIRGQLG